MVATEQLPTAVGDVSDEAKTFNREVLYVLPKRHARSYAFLSGKGHLYLTGKNSQPLRETVARPGETHLDEAKAIE